MSTIRHTWKSRDGDHVMEMVLVEGTKGSPYLFGNGTEARPIEVRDFWIATVPVTQAWWMHVLGTEDSPAVGRGAQRPLENVSWDMIVQPDGFLDRLNASGVRATMGARASPGTALFRLPSETEWEYAARGGPHWRDGFHYSGSDDIDRVAWYDRKGGAISPMRWPRSRRTNLASMTCQGMSGHGARIRLRVRSSGSRPMVAPSSAKVTTACFAAGLRQTEWLQIF
jgi:formylglycine-generating enzyme required for sulfatase activity